MSLYFHYVSPRYEEAREEEKLRTQREDFSDMVAEVNGMIRTSLCVCVCVCFLLVPW